ESLLLELASLAGGLHLSAALLDGDGGVANIEEGVVLDLLGLRFHLALDELRVDVVGLGGTVAERKSQSELGGVSWEIIVEDLRLRGAQAVLGDASDGRGDLGNVKTSDRSTASIDDLLLQVSNDAGRAGGEGVAGEALGRVIGGESGRREKRILGGAHIHIGVLEVEILLLEIGALGEGFLDGVFKDSGLDGGGGIRLVRGNNLDVDE